jgi:hypothetical protein
MRGSSRKKKNTDFERQNKMRRDKELKKKQMRMGRMKGRAVFAYFKCLT